MFYPSGMTRRPFLASLPALFAAPFVAKKAEAKDPRSEVTPEQWAWKARAESIHTGKGNDLMDRYINGEKWDSHRWELSKWQAWNERVENMMKNDLFDTPKP